MRKSILFLVLALSACAQAEITQPPILVTPTNQAAAVGIDVYVRDRSRGNPVPRFRGQETVTVRTFASVNGGAYSELSGASCLLDSGLYRAQFNTPANVGLPDYVPDSPSIFVRCTANEMSGSVTLDAFNLTAQQRMSGAAGGGLLGAIVIGAVAAANVDPAQDEYSYPAVTVQLR